MTGSLCCCNSMYTFRDYFCYHAVVAPVFPLLYVLVSVTILLLLRTSPGPATATQSSSPYLYQYSVCLSPLNSFYVRLYWIKRIAIYESKVIILTMSPTRHPVFISKCAPQTRPYHAPTRPPCLIPCVSESALVLSPLIDLDVFRSPTYPILENLA